MPPRCECRKEHVEGDRLTNQHDAKIHELRRHREALGPAPTEHQDCYKDGDYRGKMCDLRFLI